MKRDKVRQDFDAVAFKREVQTEISEEIKHLTPQEEIAYFRQTAEAGPLGVWWRSVKHVTTVAGQ